MAVYLEDALPVVKHNGLNTAKAVTMGSTLAVTGAITASGGIGAVASTGAVSGTSLSTTGLVTAKSGTAPAAGGTEMVKMGNAAAGPSILAGTGAPTAAAKQGSLYIKTDASTTNTRLYINTDGDTTWTAFTAAA